MRCIFMFRWKPNIGDKYYYLDISGSSIVDFHIWGNDKIDNRLYERGLIFKTGEEATAIANKMLNLLK